VSDIALSFLRAGEALPETGVASRLLPGALGLSTYAVGGITVAGCVTHSTIAPGANDCARRNPWLRGLRSLADIAHAPKGHAADDCDGLTVAMLAACDAGRDGGGAAPLPSREDRASSCKPSRHRHAHANHAQRVLSGIADYREDFYYRERAVRRARISYVKIKIFMIMAIGRDARCDPVSHEPANASQVT
jgi:hypothetical protein